MKNQTNRVTVKEIEEIIGQEFKVLDKGFVRVVDYMGSDSAIVQAARVSYGEGTKTIRQDEALINYLVKHKHTSPLEMCEIKLHIKLPIFIARQWIRHRTANVNEVSARYSVLPNDFYIPDEQNIAKQSSDNKQGRGEVLSPNLAKQVIEILTQDSNKCYESYKTMIGSDKFDPDTENDAENNDNLDCGIGVARELARINLNLNLYTEWYWKIDLHNLLHFLNLRMHPHAQYEIRQYANTIFNIVQKWCPFAAKAFKNHIIGSVSISRNTSKLLKDIAKYGLESDWFSNLQSNLDTELKKYDISKREYEELVKNLKN
jgi:thymidylate synthase (FAD)